MGPWLLPAQRALVALLLALLAGLAQAQEPPPPDEWLAVPAGGLRFDLGDRIVLESQRLYITPDQVRVRYRLMNTAEREAVLFVAFPFPSLPEPKPPAPTLSKSFDDAALTENGTLLPVHAITSRIYNDGHDVTAELEAAGIDLMQLTDGRLNQLSRSEYRKLERALTDRGEPRPNRYAWSLEIGPEWQVNLPPRSMTELELSYTPYSGLSVDRFSTLSELRDLKHIEAYCANEQPDLLDWMRNRMKAHKDAGLSPYLDVRRRELSYRWEALPPERAERTLRIEVSEPGRDPADTRIAFCFPGGVARLPNGTHLAGGTGKPGSKRLDILFFD